MVTSSTAYCGTQEQQPISQLVEAANTQESMVRATIEGGCVWWLWKHRGGGATTVVDGKPARHDEQLEDEWAVHDMSL